MDPALLKEREAFKRRALANPVVEKLPKKTDTESVISKTKIAKKSKDDIPKPQKGNELRLINWQYSSCVRSVFLALPTETSPTLSPL